MTKNQPDSAKEEACLLHAKRLTIPPRVRDGDWTLAELRAHLQWAVDIEHYTIPYYMAAWFSIKDQAAEAVRLLKSVVNQEMLHMQSAANLANAFGTDLVIQAPSYGGSIPHLDFTLGDVDPTKIFSPFSTDIGRFDVERLNTMCIVEFPEWFVPGDEELLEVADINYASIGELYNAIREGVTELADEIRGNHKQVEYFGHWYPEVEHLTITEDGKAGLPQAIELMDLIIGQGEGKARKVDSVPSRFQNKADDMQPALDHFDKFTYLRAQELPETWELTVGNEAGKRAQQAVLEHYGKLLVQLNHMFRGEPISDFGPIMFKVGAAISACWQNGALPIFSTPEES